MLSCPSFMVLVTWVKFLGEKLKVTIPLHLYFFHTRCTVRCLSKIDVQGNFIFTPDALSTIVFLFSQICMHRHVLFPHKKAPSDLFFQKRCTVRLFFPKQMYRQVCFSQKMRRQVSFLRTMHRQIFCTRTHTHTHTHFHTHTVTHIHTHHYACACAHTHARTHAHRMAALLVSNSIPCVRTWICRESNMYTSQNPVCAHVKEAYLCMRTYVKEPYLHSEELTEAHARTHTHTLAHTHTRKHTHKIILRNSRTHTHTQKRTYKRSHRNIRTHSETHTHTHT